MAQRLLHYDIIERLGEGAGSVIYSVRDTGTGRAFALKHVVRKRDKDVRFIEQMETEYEVSKQFTHANLRKAYELKINKTMLLKKTEAFLVLELFDGKPLEVRPPGTLLEITDAFLQAAEGLKAMHALGYVHCDIKPNNILRDAQGIVKVIDFGQSTKIGTVKERIQGTPDYISPEQVERRPITAQTDIYNFGATVYWALTGKPIPTQYTVSRQGKYGFLLDTMIQSPQDLNPKVPLPLSNLVMECISTNPKRRPADMDTAIMRLELAKHVLLKESHPHPAPEVLSPDDTNYVSDDTPDA
ncbi:MAG TPA: serine/threonine-protein kinase [Tepidisphaeraceae bacterium]